MVNSLMLENGDENLTWNANVYLCLYQEGEAFVFAFVFLGDESLGG